MDHISDIFSDIPEIEEPEEMNEQDLLMAKLLNANDYLFNSSEAEETIEILQDIVVGENKSEIK